MKNGAYELVKAPPDYPGRRYRGRYCYEHHLVYWIHTGVLIEPGECIHHRNGNKRDNHIDNLELMSTESHSTEHAPVSEMVELICPGCRGKFQRERRKTHLALKSKKQTFCSRPCIGSVVYPGSPSILR